MKDKLIKNQKIQVKKSNNNNQKTPKYMENTYNSNKCIYKYAKKYKSQIFI